MAVLADHAHSGRQTASPHFHAHYQLRHSELPEVTAAQPSVLPAHRCLRSTQDDVITSPGPVQGAGF